MKKVIFLIPNLKHGGAEKVLVNLVNNLDKSKFDVTLYSIFDVGVNKEFLNKEVTYKYKFKNIYRGNTYFFNLFSPEFLYRWFIKEHYDIAISYLEGPATRIIAGCDDKSTKKLAWIHIELNEKQKYIGFRNIKEARNYYGKFNYIIGVSKKVIENFRNLVATGLSTKVLYNTNETELIKKLAQESVDFIFDKDFINIISVAKVVKTKGFDRLIEIHKQLTDDGYKIKTHIIGIGEDMSLLKKRVNELNISDTFLFLGFDKNPYKYMSKADLYVCSSRREGFSTAVTEALVLGIPVVSTNVSGANELLGENNEYGIVTENSKDGLYKGLIEMLSNPKNLAYYKKKAEARGQFFSKENTVKAVENLLNAL